MRYAFENELGVVFLFGKLHKDLGFPENVVMLNTGRVAFTGGVDALRNDEATLTRHLGVF